MKFKSHLVGSILVAASFPFFAEEAGVNLSINDLTLMLPAIVMGGNFPDIDTASKPSRYYAIIGAFLTVYWIYTGNFEYIWLIWIPFIAAKMFKHRSFTHKLWFPLAIMFLPIIIDFAMFYFNFNIQWIQYLIIKYRQAVNAFALGICVHIFTDTRVVKKVVRFIGGEKAVKLLY